VIDVNLLLLSLFPSGAGYILFTYGRKMGRFPQLIAGLALMTYPYFSGSIAGLVGVGTLIGAALYVVLSLGY
jgi:hypothetical protein